MGDRISSFRRLGARVVALEPQPRPARAIRLIHHRDPGVTLRQAAAGERDGEITLHVNSANPTVSTASDDFVRAADGAAGWEGQVWDRTIAVPCVTLDRLIAEHGRPAFIKIDVEGFEDRVLAGLSQPVAALSFEFTTIAREVGAALPRAPRRPRTVPLQRRARRKPEAGTANTGLTLPTCRPICGSCRTRPIPAMSMRF